MPIHTRQQTVTVLECDTCGKKLQLSTPQQAATPPMGWTNTDGVIRCPRDSRRAGVQP